jgi:Fic family protein
MSRFDVEMGGDLAPFQSVLLRSESVSSSKIENLSASARAIAEAEVTGHGKRNAMVIASNTAAMSAALRLADDLDSDAILEMHRTLMDGTDPSIAGHWRDDYVWVGKDDVPHTADHVGPAPERIMDSLNDLADFMRRDDLPVMAQAAIAHAQFETIHPFFDGNGRTGRALLHSFLRGKGLVRNVTIPVSGGLLARRDEYFDALTAYREGDPEPIVTVTAEAAVRGVAHGRELVHGLRTVRDDWKDRLSGVRQHSRVHDLADGLLAQPVISAREATAILGTTNVHRHIDVLIARGILQGHQDYKSRNMLWRAQAVLDEMDAYSARIAQRRR